MGPCFSECKCSRAHLGEDSSLLGREVLAEKVIEKGKVSGQFLLGGRLCQVQQEVLASGDRCLARSDRRRTGWPPTRRPWSPPYLLLSCMLMRRMSDAAAVSLRGSVRVHFPIHDLSQGFFERCQCRVCLCDERLNGSLDQVSRGSGAGTAPQPDRTPTGVLATACTTVTAATLAPEKGFLRWRRGWRTIGEQERDFTG